MLMPHHAERVSWEALKAEVDARKSQWKDTPDEDRALIKRLLTQVGAWEARAAWWKNCTENREREAEEMKQRARDFAVALGLLPED